MTKRRDAIEAVKAVPHLVSIEQSDSDCANNGRAIALSRTVATHEPSPEEVSALRVGVNYRVGHRTYLDNPKLYTVRAHYGVPRPRGHRAFLNIAGAGK